MPVETSAIVVVGLALGTATVGILRRPLWAGLLVGALGAVVTKVAIDRASAPPASSVTPSA